MQVRTITLPTRAQPDTLCAVYILKTFGEQRFPGVSTAEIRINQILPEQTSFEIELTRENLLLDQGRGPFDHHGKNGVCLTDLVIQELSLSQRKDLLKMSEFSRRDDLEGKGIISQDRLDKAFGLPGLLVNLNKEYTTTPEKVFSIMLPIIEAHHKEEVRREYEMPNEIQKKKESGECIFFTATQKGQQLSCVLILSDNVSIPGYLKSTHGGAHDVVIQVNSFGNTVILTRPKKSINLSALALVIRLEESVLRVREFEPDFAKLLAPGTIPEVPEWYYDTATNSLLNGSSGNKNIEATKIPYTRLQEIVILGLSEKMLKSN